MVNKCSPEFIAVETIKMRRSFIRTDIDTSVARRTIGSSDHWEVGHPQEQVLERSYTYTRGEKFNARNKLIGRIYIVHAAEQGCGCITRSHRS